MNSNEQPDKITPSLQGYEDTARMQSLISKLNAASDAYYNGQAELMSDHEWDAAFDELKRLEEATGTILPNSPTANVSADNVAGTKEEHEFATLSLAKTKKPEELVKWAEGRPIWLSWKLDGLTLVATYDNGRLTKVVTRGNGHIGTNITHLSKAIDGILPTINNTGHIVIRGEAVISYTDFNQFNLESEEEYANPRNLASGSLTLKDINEVKARHLRWIPFTLVYSDEEHTSWGEQMQFLEKLGFKTVDHEEISNPTLDNIESVIDKWTRRLQGEKAYPNLSKGRNAAVDSEGLLLLDTPTANEQTRKSSSLEKPERVSAFDYPVDGLVICYDDTEFAASGSVTGHHATRGGYAFKWQDESAETKLEYIEWSCAASTISPVAVFKPVELEGTTVKRASLCNISECERLGIGDKGTKISVIKANKIIPKVINVTERLGVLTIPETCPVCKAQTVITESESSNTKTLHCTNEYCPAKQLKKFARFVSKEGVNIDGLSEQTVQKFINLGWVSEYADLFHLNEHANELRVMEGFGDKSVKKLLDSIAKARTVEARRLLFALNIPLVGQDVCTRLLSSQPLEELISTARTTDDSTVFSSIDGIGPEKSSSFVKWMQDENNKKVLDNLLSELTITQTSKESQGARCEGLTFVVTGDVHHYKNRNELKAYIESQGGKVTGSVSKSTNYLINNDVNSTSGKNKKAQQLNIPIISEDQFIERFSS